MNSLLHPSLSAIPGNPGFSLCGLSQNGTHRLEPVLLKPITHLIEAPRGFSTPDPVGIGDTNPQCFLSLTNYPVYTPQKDPNVFYHLQTASRLSTCVFYHLRKKGEGVPCPSDRSLFLSPEASPTSKPFNPNHLTHFRVGPPHLSRLFSSVCRKWEGGVP
jgi:hypothetical protein